MAQQRTASKTVTDTIVGEHTHTIVGYSLIKGIGDGEPIASERFVVGGHEWVLLFYPDGKRSSSEGPMGNGGGDGGHPGQVQLPLGGVGGLQGGVRDDQLDGVGVGLPPGPPPPAAAQGGQLQGGERRGDGGAGGGGGGGGGGDVLGHVGPNVLAAQAAAHHHAAAAAAVAAAGMAAHHGGGGMMAPMAAPMHRQQRRDTTNEYAALFVALIGEGPNPQGIVSTTEGKVVRAFHRFTLVDQTGQGRDLTKGRTRDAGAVKISCARQDPNARNCHGYRKFVKRSLLEDPSKGYLANDTLVIKYTIELVVSSGGALMRGGGGRGGAELIRVPPPSLGADLAALLASGEGADVTLVVDGEEFKAHKFLLEARSAFFRSLLNNDMREGLEGRAVVHDVRAPVFRLLLHYVYTDSLPEGMEDSGLEVEVAQHLLAAADSLQLERLRRIAERRLTECVDVESVAFTLALADRNHAAELKRVCLDYVGRNLAAVMKTEGYSHMVASCPGLQGEILSTLAALGGAGPADAAGAAGAAAGAGAGACGGAGSSRLAQCLTGGAVTGGVGGGVGSAARGAAGGATPLPLGGTGGGAGGGGGGGGLGGGHTGRVRDMLVDAVDDVRRVRPRRD
ncbi:hypothetical protein HXX76_004062 [Chlamydomonas incerta]|uniref:BTB domain-containing protein n=1 Tax=Chlamydomonas incerta TaxID=51695 RepID=A0A835T737_CHLIN|nr:hypothetical protein HXX76_004062 [Chlamydomonas incerta]|eukprot:KAG2439943.1 hypothetical protein HXX76_004062 [Chlamydomonas incerta]